MIYDNIRTICEKKNISIKQVERELGFSNSSICKWNECEPSVWKVQKVADYIAILDEQIELLKAERLEKARCYQKIERQIKQMENEDEQEVLRLRYITGLKWEEVAVRMSYSWKHIHRIHSSALCNFKMT